MTLPLLLAEVAAPGGAFQTVADLLAIFVAGVVVEVVRRIYKERAAERAELVDRLTHVAYFATAEVAKLTPTEIDDKAAYALGVFRQAFADRRKALPTREEEAQAALAWKALHGSEKLSAGLPVPH